jgi:protein O-mannosyl-transferase
VKKEIFFSEKEEICRTERHSCLVLFLVLVITAVLFSGVLTLGWTNWDDNLYIYENPLVSEARLKDIFTRPADYNTYNPLVISSFALEWKLVKDKPFLYHLDNVLLHLLCTALVWFLCRKLGLSVWWSGFTALLFGIHPMRVESVAWITERKDMLFALFYLTSILFYIRYIVSGKNKQLLLTFIFFVLSLLSKIQAVTLPFALVLLDWYFQRKIGPKALIEKVIFFAASLIVGLLGSTFFIKNVYVATDSKTVNALSFFGQVVLAGYAYAVYILKSIVPYATCTLYPMPTSLRPEHWMGAAVAVFIFAGAMAVWRKHRFITFGLLFFTFNIFLLLMPFLANDSAFLHDRYTYVAYIGLFFVIAMGMQQLSDKFPSFRLPAMGISIALLIVFGVLTVKYIPVWKNSETLWTYVIEKYPRRIPVAYLNRAHYWYKNNLPGKAIEDLSTALEINPDYLRACMNRGLIYLEKNDTRKALQDYNHCLDLMRPYDTSGNILNPSVSDALGNRGLIYFKTGQYERALADIDLAIKLNPSNVNNYLNRAFTYMQLREYDKSIQDFTFCHQCDPANPDIINNRGVCYLRSGDFKSALDDFNKAIGLNGGNFSSYMNRAAVYRKLGRIAEARQDVQTAEKLGAGIDPSFRKLLQLR